MSRSRRVLFWLTLCTIVIGPTLSAAQDETIDFSIDASFLKSLAEGHTIQPTFAVRLLHRTSGVHDLRADCEMHLAGKLAPPASFGNPPAVVVEPPNLCKNAPPGSTVTTLSALSVAWGKIFDDKVMDRDCRAQGFPRIFTEHASNGGNLANPNHVFELHPLTRLECDGTVLDFGNFLRFHRGMRAIKPTTANSCLRRRRLNVRFHEGRYEFREEGGKCGNFLIFEIGFINRAWIRNTGGGHSAIVRISPDGESRVTAKIYSLENTEADGFLTRLMTDSNDSTTEDPRARDDEVFSTRRIWHGMLTYDYFSMIKALRKDGVWSEARNWSKVPFPISIVLFGEAEDAPWGEHGNGEDN